MSDPSDISKTTVSSSGEKKTVSLTFNSLTVTKVVAVVIIIGLAFWLGFLVGHHNRLITAGSSTSSTSGFGGGGEFRRGGGSIGTVTAVSSTSITVQNSRTGASTTYAITSSTTITDSGQTIAVSSISDGETVLVVPSSTSSSDASRILVNPSFGGYGGTGSSTSGSSTTE